MSVSQDIITDFNSSKCDYETTADRCTQHSSAISIPVSAIMRPFHSRVTISVSDFNSSKCDYEDGTAKSTGKAVDNFNSSKCDYESTSSIFRSSTSPISIPVSAIMSPESLEHIIEGLTFQFQ